MNQSSDNGIIVFIQSRKIIVQDNFGAKSLQFKRLVNKKYKQKNQGNPNIK
ncbi:hypothetical protein SAMN05444380_11285 [Thermophagus xiamenensis]|nr:hypothetical protein SAMN05444380_11285 [Thermophagus xiamenensis]